MEKVGYKSPPVDKQFKPGISPNPGGKPVGARNRLTAKFLNALADDFEQDGKAAIKECREKDPSAYLRAIVALCPKELEIKKPLEELTDEQLERVVAAVEQQLLAGGTSGDVTPTPTNPGSEARN